MNLLHILQELIKYDQGAPMIFNSGIFLVMFIFFILIYALIHKNKLAVTLFVIAFGCLFYYKSSGWYLLVLIMTVFTDYSFALLIHKLKDGIYKKLALFFALSVSIGLLSYFKYTNFFLGNFYDIMGKNFQPLDIFLPIGVSFYTFQSMSYMLDVYWKKIKPCYNIINYAFFITFFPQLVAGPIVKANWFLPQVEKPITIKKEWIYSGFWMILIGLIKKAIIADYISQYNDLVFNNPTGYSGFENLMAVYGYTLQIYCDFSGYSDMAIGIARIMGFDLGVNFNFPYKARNITDFWHRWHMSLSTWLRDYLYIPLGGNREISLFTVVSVPIILLLLIILQPWQWYFFVLFISTSLIGLVAFYKSENKYLIFFAWANLLAFMVFIFDKNIYVFSYLGLILGIWIIYFINPGIKKKLITSVNQMLTMLIGGLWHGATWKFVFWGAWHGIGLAIHKILKPLLDKVPDRRTSNFVSWFITFHFVIFLWIFFRANNIEHEVYKHVQNIGPNSEIVSEIVRSGGQNLLKINVYQKDSLVQIVNQPLAVAGKNLVIRNEKSETTETVTVNQVEDGFHVAWAMIGKIVTDMDLAFLPPFLKVRYLWVILMVIGFAMHAAPLSWNDKIRDKFMNARFVFKLLIFIVLVQLVIQFKSEDVQPFIYFQF
ncbi:MAG: MBOAT family O-acyltransferase [Bacteroidales bacterium]